MRIKKEDILKAQIRINDIIHKTPVLTNQSINQISEAHLFFKCENFQKIGAFKMRGAANVVFGKNNKEKLNGFATHSSGNHAQAVALSSKLAETTAHIVMPKGAPEIKKKAVKSYGANIYYCDNNEKAREEMCNNVIKKTQSHFIHPYNDYGVITGQATCFKEMCDDGYNLDYIVSPVCGGGLASGTALSAKYFSPTTKVILAEPSNANDAYNSFIKKQLIPVETPNTIADGLKTSLGKKTFNIIINHVEAILTVSEEEIVSSMKLIWERMKIICEPSCSVALAAVIKNKKMFKNKKIGIILTGGNVDIKNLPF